MMKLPEGFSHVGDGRLSIGEEQLAKLKTPRDIGEVYLVEETWIAKGMYGIVRSAISKQSGISYAAKFLRRRRRGQCCLNEINHEIAVLMLCADSDHVVKLQAVHETRSEIALILELATGGELQTLIDEQGHLSEQKTRVCMREILRALQHMHSKSIAHLDLKPQNILLAGKTVDDGLKLCDFGIARFIAEKNKIYEIVGTPDYVAPEVLHYDPLSLQTDIWSIGVVAYVLLTGLSPFGGDSKQETFLNVTKCSLTFPDELFDGISSDAIDFIKSALRIKPKERLTVDECLEHRWLKEKTVCLREELLAARATLSRNGTGIGEWDYSTTTTTTLMGDDALLNKCEPTNGDGGGGGGGGGGGALVLENGSSNGCNVVGGVVRPHEAGTKQQQHMLAAGSNNGTVIAPSEEKPQYDAGAGEGGGDESDEGGGTASPPSLAGELRLLQRNNNGGGDTMVIPSDASSASTEDNKENVIVVGGGGGGLVVSSAACALFPDAPTTPKVSRKALPVEPLNDGGGLHYNLQQHHHHHHHLQHHNHHHHHHHSSHLHQNHHHHHHHNHLHHSNGANSHHVLNSSHQHHANQAVLHPAPPNNNNNSGGVTGAASGGPGSPFVSRQGSPSCVKKYIQKMHLQQQLVVPAGGEMATTTTTSKQDANTMVSLEEMESKIVSPSGTTGMAASSCNASSSNGGDVECCDPPEHASSFAPVTPPVSSSNGCSSSSNSNSSNSSCRTTVAAGAALCALNCTEASSVGGADSRHLASPGHKTLQQCEKDAIIC